MQLTFNTRKILPTSYERKDGTKSFQATLFTPVNYGIRLEPGVMPVEQMQAVLEQCAENAEEVEIEFTEGRYQNGGAYMQVYAVRPVKAVNVAKSS
jgi:hypothetical protein